MAAKAKEGEQYERKTQLEHVLLRPGMYIGSTHPESRDVWLCRDGRMARESVVVPQGLLKIFDEILVNAADNMQRDTAMTYIRITADKRRISIENDGGTIPVEMHATEGMYVPELVFGHLLTGSNFDDASARLTGGRHGYGAKLTNIFSKTFTVESVDATRRKRYQQTWTDNMRGRQDPTVSSSRVRDKSFTRVTFEPDLERFGMEELSDEILALMHRRAIDVAACNKRLRVTWNGEAVPVRGFEEFAALFAGSGGQGPLVEEAGDRWQIAVLPSPTGQFEQISFVNSMHTPRGGTHVVHAVEPVIQSLVETLQKKHPALGVTRALIRQRMMVIVRAMIENPDFDSQAKEQLTSRAASFGSVCAPSAAFLKRVAAHGPLVAPIIGDARGKQHAELLKATRVKRGSRLALLDVPKLEDANAAGGKHSDRCTLILTEGDSAKALAVAGLAVVGRDHYGVFPLRGKLLNVRDATPAQIRRNEEVTNLVRVLGLNFADTYAAADGSASPGLRYGRVLIMTDQDHDGSHIKGLILNMFHHFWPALLQRPGFLAEFVTPVLKARRGKEERQFFTIQDYEAWRRALSPEERARWHTKYYKGLGTSTAEEGREYFRHLDRHILNFTCASPKEASLLDMAFSKKRAADRKKWLSTKYRPGAVVDYGMNSLSVDEFVNRELIHFSYADIVRSIPSAVDGLKPAQRKVLHACLQRDPRTEVKVAQLAGFVAERTAYHHGEASLHATIVNMAQDFVGSNNLPLLEPVGQFGTRLQGGKDAASARYIFTRLSSLARLVFRQEDARALRHRFDDDQRVEPEVFAPIVPMALVNGAEGIGTGWSTFLPPHHPVHVLDAVAARVRGRGVAKAARSHRLVPWVRGFRGTIARASPRGAVGWRTRGLFEVRPPKRGEVGESEVLVHELPVGRWTEDYRAHLSRMVTEGGALRSFREHHTENDVRFELRFAAGADILRAEADLVRTLRLETSMPASNMHLFDADGRIKRYATAEAVVKDFFPVRLAMYDRRRAIQDAQLAARAARIRNQARFVADVCSGAVGLLGTPRDSLLALLGERGYDTEGAFVAEDARIAAALLDGTHARDPMVTKAAAASEPGADGPSTTFDYLLRLPLSSLTLERRQSLLELEAAAARDLEQLRATDSFTLWECELSELREHLLGDPEYARGVTDA